MRIHRLIAGLLAALSVAACSRGPADAKAPLVGAWRGGVQFTTGAFATTKDLEFMYVFNLGGTMTESSNYDGAPPVPPAYGVWRMVGAKKYEARYAYYWTKPPSSFEAIAKGNGRAPGGQGMLSQEITLSADGNSFESMLRYQVFDQAGKPTGEASIASAKAARIGF
jgi:hypothetical protein